MSDSKRESIERHAADETEPAESPENDRKGGVADKSKGVNSYEPGGEGKPDKNKRISE